jgi:hypothetical protein
LAKSTVFNLFTPDRELLLNCGSGPGANRARKPATRAEKILKVDE